MLQQIATFRKNTVFDIMIGCLGAWVFVAAILTRTVTGFLFSMLSAMALVGVAMIALSLFAKAVRAFKDSR